MTEALSRDDDDEKIAIRRANETQLEPNSRNNTPRQKEAREEYVEEDAQANLERDRRSEITVADCVCGRGAESTTKIRNARA